MDQLVIIKNGHSFLVRENVDFWELWQNGNWEPETFRILDRFLTPDTAYVDLGAWIGPTVLYASQLAKRCFALEPDIIAYKQLCRNLATNDIRNVATFNEAILDYDGAAVFGSEHLGNSMTRLSYLGDNRFEIPCSTLAAFDAKHGIPSPMFIKMDIEGAEELVLKSTEFFSARKPILYVSLHPQWFTNAAEGWQTLNAVRELYEHCYDADLKEVEIGWEHKALVFA